MLAHGQGEAAAADGVAGFPLPVPKVNVRLGRSQKREVDTVRNAPDIRSLTRAIRRGDAEAFARFYDLYSFRVYKYLLVVARGEELDAREVCQAVLIKLTKHLKVFDDDAQLWAWLCTLAKRTFIDHCRARKRWSRFIPMEEPDFNCGCESKTSGAHVLSEMLGEALADMAAEERELIQAAYMDGRPLQELADASGQTYKAVESRLARLRRKLKERLLKKVRDENES
jgi:RNA polymerase sigma-70 factor, ECF subfamily